MFPNLFKNKSKRIQILTDEEKIQIEEALDDGEKPTKIAEDYGYDLKAVYRHYNVLAKRKEKANKEAESDPFKDSMKLLNQKIKYMQQQKIYQDLKRDLEEDAYDDDDEVDPQTPIEQQILLEAIKAFRSKQSSERGGDDFGNINIPQSSPPPQADAEIPQDLAPEQIKEIIDNLDPKMLKIAKSLDPDTLKTLIRNKYPLTEKSLEYALEVIYDSKQTTLKA